MNQKTKHFLIVLALSVCLFLTLVLVVSCYDNVAFKYETKYVESEINRTICVENERIRCTYPSYHKGSNKIEMYFEIHDGTHGQEKEGERSRTIYPDISKTIPNLFYAEKKSPSVLKVVTG